MFTSDSPCSHPQGESGEQGGAVDRVGPASGAIGESSPSLPPRCQGDTRQRPSGAHPGPATPRLCPTPEDRTPRLRRQQLGFCHPQRRAGGRFLFVTRVTGAHPITHEASEPAAVPAAHLSLLPLLGGGFSLPCWLFSRPPPPAGPFGRWQMGMDVTLSISLPLLCPEIISVTFQEGAD